MKFTLQQLAKQLELEFKGEANQEITGVASLGSAKLGANTTIDRGALNNTVIEQGCKLDNLIQIAHNVRIGAHTAIAACVGIAGSANIGQYCKT